MPRYLLALEVAVLLAKVSDLRKHLFIDALWNSGGRLNEIIPLTREDFMLDDPATGAPLGSPFVVLVHPQAARARGGRPQPSADEGG